MTKAGIDITQYKAMLSKASASSIEKAKLVSKNSQKGAAVSAIIEMRWGTADVHLHSKSVDESGSWEPLDVVFYFSMISRPVYHTFKCMPC